MISLDTETTGLDLRHAARPFFVTTCEEDGTQRWWEWDVDPLTREVRVPDGDAKEIKKILSSPHQMIGQNIKFDATALAQVGIDDWPWSRTYDTLLAGHLLASNQPHNLTDMSIHYLGIDIEPKEKALEAAVKECRRMVQQARLKKKRGGEGGDLADWTIADVGVSGMPSVNQGKAFRSDYWLPRAMADYLGHPNDHPYRAVLTDYANADSAVTLALWKVMRRELERRGLWEIYLTRLELLPVVYEMERSGVTLSKHRLDQLTREYGDESERAGRVCVNIAAGLGYELAMPAGGNNQSLRTFCFGPLALPQLKHSEKTGEPSLDKHVIEEYEATLPPGSPQLTFVRTLKGKRARDTAIAYMDGYSRFWKDAGDGFRVLHPSLNVTGTDTLRMSSSAPNEQNISKRENFNLRYCFGPAPGREWWSLDAKNIELRLAFYESGEQELIRLFETPDDPPYYGSVHLINFHTVYGPIWDKELKAVGWEKVGPHCKEKYKATWYQHCKNGGFAKQYGGGRNKVDATFHRAGAFDLLDGRFSKLAELNERCIRYAERYGYVETIPDRTVNPKHGYPLLCTRTDYGKILTTVPLNYRTQGTAMWWMCRAMVRVSRQLDDWRREGFDGRIVMQVHDELVLDFPKSDLHYDGDAEKPAVISNLPRVRAVQALMARGGEDIGIPTPVGAEYNPEHWAEGIAI